MIMRCAIADAYERRLDFDSYSFCHGLRHVALVTLLPRVKTCNWEGVGRRMERVTCDGACN